MSHLPLLPKQARKKHFPKNTLGPIDNVLPEDRVNAWHRTVTGPSSTETPQNLIAMVTHAHAYWDKARFALRYQMMGRLWLSSFSGCLNHTREREMD